MEAQQTMLKMRIADLKKELEKHPLLLLLASLIRVNDLDDARIILESLGHFQRSIDLAVSGTLLQSLI